MSKPNSKKIKICYVLLCHKNPKGVIEQIDYLLKTGGCVVYHMDKNAPKAYHDEIKNHFKNHNNVTTVPSVPAGWGDWSLVKATLRMLTQATMVFEKVTHYQYLSGDCLPIHSASSIEATLKNTHADIIETADFFTSGWIQTGPHLERIEYYHFFNERRRKWFFYRSYDIQRYLRIKRQIPEGLKMSIGSQWWCLRRKTVERILDYLLLRPEIIKFFKRTWIPDEIFFQTLAATLVPARERISNPSTFLRFSDYGLPTVFYDDHYDFLTSQERFFGRKVSPEAINLRKRLIRNFTEPDKDPKIIDIGSKEINHGLKTMNFIIHTGRTGSRYGSCIWENSGKIAGDKQVFAIVSKKWHVGNRFGAALSRVTGIPYFNYLYDDSNARPLGMGNLENGMEKRQKNAAAFLSTLMSLNRLNQVIIGVDPSRFDQLRELNSNCSDLRIIELENEFDTNYLQGHAERMGLMNAKGASVQKNALHNAILETLRQEAQRLHEIDFRRHEKIRAWHSSRLRSEILANIFEREPADFINMVRHIEIKD